MRRVIAKLKTKSSELGGIQMQIVKLMLHKLMDIITGKVNLYLENGTFSIH